MAKRVKTKTVHVRVTERQYERMWGLANRWEMSKSDVVRLAITRLLARAPNTEGRQTGADDIR